MQTLTCSECKKSWHREARRGKKPIRCPGCVDGKKPGARGVDEYTEILIQKYGYKPEKIKWWCRSNSHEACETMDWAAGSKYNCRCKCHKGKE